MIEEPTPTPPGNKQEPTSLFSRHELWIGLICAFVGAVFAITLVPAAKGLWHVVHPRHHKLVIAGWGPERPVYWCKRPNSCDGADHVVFNSYANAPEYGDERPFIDAKPATDRSPGGFHDVLHVQPGEIVVIRMLIDNSAWEARTGKRGGIAHGTRARFEIPQNVGRVHYVYGFLSAKNARPRFVWDGTTLVSPHNTRLRFVFGSGHWWRTNSAVPDAVVEDGTLIGETKLDGEFGDQFIDSGFLTVKARVESAVNR